MNKEHKEHAENSTMQLFMVTLIESAGSHISTHRRLFYAHSESHAGELTASYVEEMYDEFDGYDPEREEWTFQESDIGVSIGVIEPITEKEAMEKLFNDALVKE